MSVVTKQARKKRSRLDAFNQGAESVINPILRAMDQADMAAHRALNPAAYKTLRALVKMPEIVTKIGAAALVSAFMAGNPDTIDRQAVLSDLCAANASDNHKKLCKEIVALQNLSFQDKLLAASIAQKFEDSPQQHRAIASIIRASNKTGFSLKAAMTIAMMESTLGKNIDAEESTAKGTFQYIDDTWMESVARHAKALGINTSLDRETILSLRVKDHDIHSEIALRDLAAAHPHLVKGNLPVADKLKLGAYAAGLGNAYELMMLVPRRMAQLVRYDHNRHDDDHMSALAVQEFEKHIVAEAYLSHFLGKTGAKNFLAALKNPRNKNEKFTLASDDFAAAAKVNKGIFGQNGQYSYVEVYSRIMDKVDGAYNMFDKINNQFAAAYEGRVDAEIGNRAARLAPKSKIVVPAEVLSAPDFIGKRVPYPTPNPRRQQQQENLIGDNGDLGPRAFTPAVNQDEVVAQTAASKLGTSIESAQIAVPHSILNGEITADSAKEFIAHLKRGLEQTGADNYYYAFINTPGGSVSAGYDILTELNRLVEQAGYRKLRVVTTSANSMGLPIAAGFAGKRMILREAGVMAHAPYFRNADGSVCKYNDPCLTENQKADLENDINRFAEIVARRSCVLSKNEAALLFTPKDRQISVTEMMRYDMADHVFQLTNNGWVKVLEEHNHGADRCKPIADLDELMKLIEPQQEQQFQGIPLHKVPVPQPARR